MEEKPTGTAGWVSLIEKMKLIKNPSIALWDQVASIADNATFFHTSTWAKIILDTFPQFQIATRGVELDDGEIVVLPMVATVERNKVFMWLESMYLGGYGGLISTRTLRADEVKSVLKLMISSRKAHIHLIGNPLFEYELPRSFKQLDLFTHILDLGGFDEVFQRFSSDRRRNIRKAKELNLQFYVADIEDQFETYFKIYEDTLNRWGEKTLVSYPYSLFEAIYRYKSDSVKLWLAKVDDRIVSGKIIFYHRKFAYYWHGSTLEEYLNLYPDPFLMSEIIRDACQRGYKGIDFGPSGGLKGVETYKEKFGARKVSFHSYEWDDNAVYHIYRGILRFLRK